MGYPELSRALREETQRQLAEMAEKAAHAAAEVLAAAGREATLERAAALAAEERANAEAARRAAARHALEEERALLVEARRLLGGLEEEVAARLPGFLDGDLVVRLAREVVAELDGGGWELRVPAAHVEAVKEAVDVAVVEADVAGVVASRGGRTVDNTLLARLARAWPGLEPELGRLLFDEEAP